MAVIIYSCNQQCGFTKELHVQLVQKIQMEWKNSVDWP